MHAALAELEVNADSETETTYLLWLTQIIRHYRLGESPRQTLKRSWYDLLGMRVAMAAEQRLVERLHVND